MRDVALGELGVEVALLRAALPIAGEQAEHEQGGDVGQEKARLSNIFISQLQGCGRAVSACAMRRQTFSRKRGGRGAATFQWSSASRSVLSSPGFI